MKCEANLRRKEKREKRSFQLVRVNLNAEGGKKRQRRLGHTASSVLYMTKSFLRNFCSRRDYRRFRMDRPRIAVTVT